MIAYRKTSLKFIKWAKHVHLGETYLPTYLPTYLSTYLQA